jgi:hypothetical protein
MIFHASFLDAFIINHHTRIKKKSNCSIPVAVVAKLEAK